MKMKTSPQHFQWILRGTVPDSRWGDIERWLFNSNYQVFVECIVKPWPQGVRCGTVLTVLFLKNYVWVI